jgi:predicted DNA-binding transcriptional regulator AlpA
MTNECRPDADQGAALPERLIGETALARHWGISRRTLQRLRARGEGPPWIAIGGSVRYRWVDIMAFEDRAMRTGGGS